MRLRGAVIGALNLFDFTTGEMRPAHIEAAQALADVGTIAILAHRAALEAQVRNEELNHALSSPARHFRTRRLTPVSPP